MFLLFDRLRTGPFRVRRKLVDEVRSLDVVERGANGFAVDLHLDRALPCVEDGAAQDALTVAGRATKLNLGELVPRILEIAQRTKRAVQAGRAHLELVAVRDDVGHVESRG